jgi:hypothetical protein
MILVHVAYDLEILGRCGSVRSWSTQEDAPVFHSSILKDMFILTPVLPTGQYRSFLGQNLPRVVAAGHWRVTWVILIDKYASNFTFFGELVTWLRNEPTVRAVIGLANFSSIADEGLKQWSQHAHGWFSGQQIVVLVTQGELLPKARATRTNKKSKEFYPDLVHETFADAWFYHPDGDNTLPCCFFRFTDHVVRTHKKCELLIFGQLRQNNVRVSPWNPQPRSIDTSQILVHSRLLSRYNVFWGLSTSCCPDGEFIRDAFQAASMDSGKVVMDGTVCAFHNRLRWNVPLYPCTVRTRYTISSDLRGGKVEEVLED